MVPFMSKAAICCTDGSWLPYRSQVLCISAQPAGSSFSLMPGRRWLATKWRASCLGPGTLAWGPGSAQKLHAGRHP